MGWVGHIIANILLFSTIAFIIVLRHLDKDNKYASVAYLSSCPFCGRPYETWNRPGQGKLRICYGCKRNCYGDGSVTGLNDEDRLKLQQEADDCQRVASGIYDDACRSIINTWATSVHQPSSLFTIRDNLIVLWSGHTDISRCPSKFFSPSLSTFAGKNALARRLHHLLNKRLGEAAKLYNIISEDNTVTVDWIP